MLALLALPMDGRALAAAADPLAAPRPVTLRLDQASVARLALAEEGAAQEGDTEKPKPMGDDEPKVTVSKVPPGGTAVSTTKKPGAAASGDKYAFVKDWPFWVIVGGVVVASVAVFMIYRNANQEEACPQRFSAGCFGER